MAEDILYTNILQVNAAKKEEEPAEEEEMSTVRPRLILIASIIIALGIVLTAINYLQPGPTGEVIIDLNVTTTVPEETTTTVGETTIPEETTTTVEETTTTTVPSLEGFSVVLKKDSETWEKFMVLEGDVPQDIDLSRAILVEVYPTETSFFREVAFTWTESGTTVEETAFSEPTENHVTKVTMTWNHPSSAGILKEVGKLLSYSTGDYNVKVLIDGSEVASCVVTGTGGPYTNSCSLDVRYEADDEVKIVVSDNKVWLTKTDFGFISSDTPGGKDPFIAVKYVKDLKKTIEFDSDADMVYLFYK